MFSATPFVPPPVAPPLPVEPMMPPAPPVGMVPAPVPPQPQMVPVPMPMPIQAQVLRPKKRGGMSPRLIKSALSTYGTPDMGPGGMPMPAPVGPPPPMAQAAQLKPGWGGGQ
jgi:hypothetical protein